MSHTVVGVFSYTSEAQEAKEYLVNNGFNSADIDIATREGVTDDHEEDFGDRVSNFFSNLFGGDDDDTRNKYTEAGRRGTIVTVHARSSDEAQRAAEILDNYGANDVDSNYGDNTTGATTFGGAGNYEANRLTNTSNTLSDQELQESNLNNKLSDDEDDTAGYKNIDLPAGTIPIIQEDLQVGKREGETGGVRLRSRIVERPVEETIRLRQEHVNVERTPVNRPATDADFNNFKEGTVEVREHNEVPVVAKDARVVEEVKLDKEVSEREETVRGTVRNTEVNTENLNNTTDNPVYRSDSNNSYNDYKDNV
jgi:stress response protein YsnF